MLCKISDLLVEVPETGDLPRRCGDYLYEGFDRPDIVIRAEDYRWKRYSSTAEAWLVSYLESGAQYFRELPRFDGFYLHASAVVVEGRAYLFSGPSGVGKSTHTHMWQEEFGGVILNDDKPTLRFIDGVWQVYGSPWCGKDGINRNEKAPLAGICFLKQGQENTIRRLSPAQAMKQILSQTIHRFHTQERLDLMLGQLDRLLPGIPVYELTNVPEPQAARLSHETMTRGAKECGL